MADWSIDPGFHDDPPNVPTGDECEAWFRGENCGRTDCRKCGKDAATDLFARARGSRRGVIALTQEILRLDGACHDYCVTIGDLARLRRPLTTNATLSTVRCRRAFAWAEGVLTGVRGDRWLEHGDYPGYPDEQAAYMIGRLLVELHKVNEHLSGLEAQAMANAQEVNRCPSTPD